MPVNHCISSVSYFAALQHIYYWLYLLYFQIDPEGKAAICQGLQVNDCIIKINDVKVDTHRQAVQLVLNAFYTLKLTVNRITM